MKKASNRKLGLVLRPLATMVLMVMLMLGVQQVQAQTVQQNTNNSIPANLVGTETAKTILKGQMATLDDQLANQTQGSAAYNQTNLRKRYYTTIFNNIVVGSTVADAVNKSVTFAVSSDEGYDDSTATRTLIKGFRQEIIVLLTQ